MTPTYTSVMTPQQLRFSENIGTILAGFITWCAAQDKYQAMFENNDEAHFLEGLSNSLSFKHDYEMFLVEALS